MFVPNGNDLPFVVIKQQTFEARIFLANAGETPRNAIVHRERDLPATSQNHRVAPRLASYHLRCAIAQCFADFPSSSVVN